MEETGDPSGVLGLLYSLSSEWRNPTEVLISPISDIKNEPAYQKAIEDGCKLRWVDEGNLRRMSREGWRPLTERDKIGRPTVFLSRDKKLLAMVLPSEGAA